MLMTESSVSSVFMTALRKRLPYAVIIKHRDASFIGLPDCSVTFRGRVWWLEFKLITTKTFKVKDIKKVAAKSPVQYKMMLRMDCAATEANYIAWVKKAGWCVVWRPADEQALAVDQKDLVDRFAEKLESYADARTN